MRKLYQIYLPMDLVNYGAIFLTVATHTQKCLLIQFKWIMTGFSSISLKL
jgi:hypothetical protein